MSNYVDGIEFVTELCCNCGMAFAMTSDFKLRRRNDHQSFYCPAGHGQHYTGKSEEQKLREQLEAESGRAALLEQERAEAEKKYRRIRDRVKNGVCPCCNRTFQGLLNHMRTEHPEFGSPKILKTLREAMGLTQSALAKEIGLAHPSYVSGYENERPVPAYAEKRLERWISAHE
jgi:DNA-binding XRE family transcriptional regulator